jgi:F-box protein 11
MTSISPGDSAALARALSTPDTAVEIPPGDYTGPFQIAQGVAAAPAAGAHVRLLATTQAVAAYITGPGVSLEGLHIAGLHLIEKAEAKITRCLITDSPQEGILVPTRAKLDLSDTKITRSTSISVHLNGGEAALRQCLITDGRKAGLVFSAGSRGTVIGCTLSGHGPAMPQVMIWQRSAPILRDCHIQDGKGIGILISESARPRLEHCQITRHAGISIHIDSAAEPQLIECKIGPGEQNGIVLTQNATLQAERCEIAGHGPKFAQIFISHGATATLNDLHLRDGRGPGLFLEHNAEAKLKKCQFHGHQGPGIFAAASRLHLDTCQLTSGAHHGLMLRQKAEATAEKTTFDGHPPSFSEAFVETEASLTLRHCHLTSGKGHGVRVAGAQARIEDTEITGLAGSGVFAEQKARVFLRGCKVHACGRNSLVLLSEGNCTIDDSDFIGTHDEYPLLNIGDKSHLAMRASRITQTGSAGLWFYQASTGIVENCTIEGTRAALFVSHAGAPKLTACTLRSQKYALHLAADGGGIYKNCVFHAPLPIHIPPSSPASFEGCTANDHPWQRPTPGPNLSQSNAAAPSQLDALLAQLHSLIGLDTVKQKISEATSTARAMRARQLQGLPIVSISYHTVFTGNPGTGKTTVARLMGALYKAIGVLPSGHLIECDRSKLVAEFIGQTAIKTNTIIDKALGGILFIDEAYTLSSGGPNDYGKEAIDTLLKRMEDDRDKFIVIAAGYPADMDAFLKSNTGFRSRFRQFIDFPDYSPQELLQIFLAIAKKTGTTVTTALQQRLTAHLTHLHAHRDDTYANARTVDNLFQKIVGNQARRIDPATATRDQLANLDAPDLP